MTSNLFQSLPPMLEILEFHWVSYMKETSNKLLVAMLLKRLQRLQKLMTPLQTLPPEASQTPSQTTPKPGSKAPSESTPET